MFKFTVLFFLALCLSACTGTNAQSGVIAPLQTAHNVTETAWRVEAQFPDACFVVYKDGCGASACFNGRQHEIEAAAVQTQNSEWTAANTDTGDYIVLNAVTGVVTMKVGGVFGIFLPNVEGTAGM